jgi:hypothetical protein
MTTHWWVSETINGVKLAEGIVETDEQPAGTAGEKIRKAADNLAAHLAGTAATALGLSPIHVCWLRRKGGYMSYTIEPKRQPHELLWRRSDNRVR